MSEPKTPVSDTPVEVYVVAKRCVYVNDYRIAGSKPYYSENLPSHTLMTKLGDVLAAFTDQQIKDALAEKAAALDAAEKWFAKEGHGPKAIKQLANEIRSGGWKEKP